MFTHKLTYIHNKLELEHNKLKHACTHLHMCARAQFALFGQSVEAQSSSSDSLPIAAIGGAVGAAVLAVVVVVVLLRARARRHDAQLASTALTASSVAISTEEAGSGLELARRAAATPPIEATGEIEGGYQGSGRA